MAIKLRSYYEKQHNLGFALYNFLIFLDTQLHEPKISGRTSKRKIFWLWRSSFSGERSLIQRSSEHKK